MSDSQIDSIISSAIEKIKSISDISTIVGDAIVIDNVTMLPVSKLSIGFVAGGGEYGARKDEIKKTKAYPFTGGSGGGVCVQPIGFLCITGKNVKFIRADGKSPYDKLFETLPKVVEGVVEGIKSGEKDEK